MDKKSEKQPKKLAKSRKLSSKEHHTLIEWCRWFIEEINSMDLSEQKNRDEGVNDG